ncbi:hypothetical protein [Hyphobacterium sp.]|uniref:hypothetical protein n=1 Tax=Hyphobacterium sp. TaxID=2004662 RepID=UPI003B52B5B4
MVLSFFGEDLAFAGLRAGDFLVVFLATGAAFLAAGFAEAFVAAGFWALAGLASVFAAFAAGFLTVSVISNSSVATRLFAVAAFI